MSGKPVTAAGPTTEAGQTLIAAWRHVSVPWMEQQIAAIEAEATADLRASLAAAVRTLADDYERKHAQSEIDAAEFGPKAGAHGRWKARQEGAEAAARLIEGSPEPAEPGEGT